MDLLRWVAPVVLALVLGASAGTKLAAPTRVRTSFTAHGLPAPGVLAYVVPGVELVTAVALIATPPLGAAMALALLVAFTGFLATVLARGSTEPCACFGRIRDRPVSGAHLLRNLVLAGLAVVTLVWPPV